MANYYAMSAVGRAQRNRRWEGTLTVCGVVFFLGVFLSIGYFGYTHGILPIQEALASAVSPR